EFRRVLFRSADADHVMLRPEARSQLLGGTRQQRGVEPDGREERSDFHISPRRRFVEREDAGGLAAGAYATDGVFDGALHFGMLGVARMPQAGRQVGRADEYAVHAVHLGDVLEPIQPLTGFDLHQQAKLIFAGLHVVADLPEAAGAHDSAHATQAARRIAHARYRLLGLLGALHVWNEQGLRTDVQVTLLLDQIVPAGAYDGRNGIRSGGLQLAQYGLNVVGRVFGVEHQPIEAGACNDLGAVVMRQ